MAELTLTAGDYRLVLTPQRGGSVSRFDWRGEPLFRPTCGPSILDTACFPLVPFSNRIAHGRFYDGDRAVRIAPNFPSADHPHPLHGFGWLASWTVVEADGEQAVLHHNYDGADWPWPYHAEQHFALRSDGLLHTLAVTNLGRTAMPAGLGSHPYFPRDGETIYRGAHRAEWRTAADGLPTSRTVSDTAKDWWAGLPVQSRCVDTAYQGREGPLSIDWPQRGITLLIDPCVELGTTVVYTPFEADFFCVEPVTHTTDAINRRLADDGLCWLPPADTMTVSIRYHAVLRSPSKPTTSSRSGVPRSI